MLRRRMTTSSCPRTTAAVSKQWASRDEHGFTEYVHTTKYILF